MHIMRFAHRLGLCFVLVVAACADDGAGSTTATGTGSGSGGGTAGSTSEPIDFSTTDTDGDGLSDIEELAGWTIGVDETGTSNTLETPYILPRYIEVTSDPNVADTDGDGLSDLAERVAGTDPRRADTDLDGLSDAAELLRWGTSPITVDTDRDARGQNPAPGTAPDSSMFDGAELNLIDSPLVPGTKVPGPGATSPIDPDTDGDSVWDLEEAASATRSPIIADMPELRIQPDSLDEFGIYLDVVETISQEQVDEVSTDLGFGVGTNMETYATMSLMLAAWASYQMNIGVQINGGVNLEQLGVDAGIAGRTEAHVGTKLTTAMTAGLTTEFEKTANQTFAEATEVTQSVDREISGGRVVAGIKLRNAGRIAFAAAGPSVNLSYVDPNGDLKPVGVMTPQNPQDAYTLAAGESIDVLMEVRDVPTDRLMSLLEFPERLIFAPGAMDILNAGDEEYAFIEEDVLFRSAALVLDFGDGRVERHHVAAHVARDADGNALGLPVTDMLTALGVEHDDGDDGNGAYRIEDYATVLHVGDAKDLQAEGLDVPGYAFTTGPGARPLREGWGAVLHNADGTIDVYTNLMAARVLPGEQVTFMRVKDEDRDGISDVHERLRGSSDDAVDSDDDGLSDFWEIREGWTVQVGGQAAERVFSSPASPDADGDGLTDAEEFALGTHPLRFDTDHDGVGDAGDAAPTTFDGVGLTNIQTYLDDCSEEGCANAWSNTPGYNLVALGWTLPPGTTAVVLRTVSPLGEDSTFDPSSITVSDDVDATIADGIVTRLYEGTASTLEDYDLVDNMRHTYHFYGQVLGSDGVLYMAYSGSESRDFEPAPYSPEFYHVVAVRLSPFVLDEVNHGSGHQDPFNAYYSHEITLEYPGFGGDPVTATIPPNLKGAFVVNRHSWYYENNSVQEGQITIQDTPDPNNPDWDETNYSAVPANTANNVLPTVIVCARNNGLLKVSLANFDMDGYTGDCFDPDNGTGAFLAPTPQEFGLDILNYGNECDDRWMSQLPAFALTIPDVGASEWQATGATPPPSQWMWGWGPHGWVYKEDFPQKRDRDYYSGETAIHALSARQYVDFNYLGYMRNEDAEFLCDMGWGVEPPELPGGGE